MLVFIQNLLQLLLYLSAVETQSCVFLPPLSKIGFNFGIAASCYTFVPVRNFCDYRLSRHVLGRHDVTRIFNNTTVVTKIVGDNYRVINRGIPVDRVAAATRTHIRPVGLREVNEPTSPGVRAERLEAGGRTLAVLSSTPHVEAWKRVVNWAYQGAEPVVMNPPVAMTLIRSAPCLW